jgi:hypothetical protein
MSPPSTVAVPSGVDLTATPGEREPHSDEPIGRLAICRQPMAITD